MLWNLEQRGRPYNLTSWTDYWLLWAAHVVAEIEEWTDWISDYNYKMEL